MKKIKRIGMSLIALVFAGIGTSGFSACGKTEEEIIIDVSKTQLRVFNFNGGVGKEWLSSIIERFEEAYKDTEFEPGTGKKGVQIVPANEKASVETLLTSGNAVIYSEAVNYSSLVSSGKLADISDIVSEPLNNVVKTEDTSSIESKLYSASKEYLTFSNGKYYGLPHYSYYSSVIYNKKLFQDYNFYFADDVEITVDTELRDYFIGPYNTTKSCGPDGQKGTDDDGLPATWDEFFMLCDYMADNGVTPFIWNSANTGESIEYLLNAVYLNLAGKEQADLNYTYDSKGKTIEIVESFSSGRPVVTKSDVTADNYASVLQSQLAKYQALEVAQKIVSGNKYRDGRALSSAGSMLSVQKDYLLSRSESKPIAFLVEGSYWYNESDDVDYFENAKKQYPNFADENEFVPMILPRVYNGSHSDIENTDVHNYVVNDQPDSYVFIPKTIENDPVTFNLAKLFIAFSCTQESLQEFTVETRCAKNYNYDVDFTKLDDYAKANWLHYKNADLVNPYSGSDIYLNKKRHFSLHLSNAFWQGKTYRSAYSKFKNGTTAEDYFNDLCAKEI